MTKVPRVSLRQIADELDMIDQETQVYLNRRTGETVSYNPAWDVREEAEQLAEIIESNEHLVPLPNAFDIHEWSIMERFAESVEPEGLRDDLLHALHGRGAFCMFKETVHRKDVRAAWYAFRDAALIAIARERLGEQGIDYVDDVGTQDDARNEREGA